MNEMVIHSSEQGNKQPAVGSTHNQGFNAGSRSAARLGAARLGGPLLATLARSTPITSATRPEMFQPRYETGGEVGLTNPASPGLLEPAVSFFRGQSAGDK